LKDKSILVRVRLSDGDAVGDMAQTVKPGEGFGKYSYEELLKHGDGEIEL